MSNDDRTVHMSFGTHIMVTILCVALVVSALQLGRIHEDLQQLNEIMTARPAIDAAARENGGNQ